MKSILLATADREHTVSLTGILEKRGDFVIPAGDADLAHAFLQSDLRIDAVIVDHDMEDSREIMDAVRSRALPPPVIVLSGRVVVAEYLAAVSAGVFDFFFWPVNPAEFLRVLETALRQTPQDLVSTDARRYGAMNFPWASSGPTAPSI